MVNMYSKYDNMDRKVLYALICIKNRVNKMHKLYVTNILALSQQKYALDLLRDIRLLGCKPKSSLIQSETWILGG